LLLLGLPDAFKKNTRPISGTKCIITIKEMDRVITFSGGIAWNAIPEPFSAINKLIELIF